MARQQKLNELDRFRKQSGRLILEAHGHCEVPAGCGGVVLRWRNPFAAVPLVLHFYSPWPGRLLLDGVEPSSGWAELPPGRHVLALEFLTADASDGLFLFAALHTPGEARSPIEVREPAVKVVSQADGTWKFTRHAPVGDGWKTLSFDDASWPALVALPTPPIDRDQPGAYQVRACTEQGAAFLGVPPDDRGTKGVWVRKVLEIPGPADSGKGG